MSLLHQNSGSIGKSIPSALKISLDPWDFAWVSPPGKSLSIVNSQNGDCLRVPRWWCEYEIYLLNLLNLRSNIEQFERFLQIALLELRPAIEYLISEFDICIDFDTHEYIWKYSYKTDTK